MKTTTRTAITLLIVLAALAAFGTIFLYPGVYDVSGGGAISRYYGEVHAPQHVRVALPAQQCA